MEKVLVSLTPAQLNYLDRGAQQAGINRSEYLRRVLDQIRNQEREYEKFKRERRADSGYTP